MPDSQVEQYIKQLTPMEKKAHEIAIDHLETSFNIEKSIGYKTWIKKQSD